MRVVNPVPPISVRRILASASLERFSLLDCFPFLPLQIVANIRGPYQTTLPGALCRFWHEATRLRQRATFESHNPIGSGAKLEDYSDDQ